MRFAKYILIIGLVLPLNALQRPQGSVQPTGDRAIYGTVLDDDRQPVQGVTVRAMRPTFDSNGATNLVAAGRAALTDAGGRYALMNLPPDIYVVSVDPGTPGIPGRRSTTTRFFSTIYYP